MCESIRKVLIEYRNCTMQIIDALMKEEIDSLEELVQARQQILEKILEIHYSKEEIKQISEEFELQQLQDKMNALMYNKMDFIKLQIQKISHNKLLTNAYNRIGSGANIFSKKI